MPRPITIEKMVSMFKERHETTHLFKIDNFSLLAKYKIEPLCSSVFELGGLTWQLRVYAQGYKNGGEHVSVFLENQDSLDVTFKYELFVVSQLEPKWHSSGIHKIGPSQPKARKGVSQLISICDPDVAKEFFIGDCCMIGVKLHGVGSGEPATAECFRLIEKPPNHKVTWLIPKLSSLDPQDSHYSSQFVVGNRKWRISILPGGYRKAKGKFFSVYLTAEEFIKNEPKTETYAAFKLRVLDQVKRNHIEQQHWDWFEKDVEVGNDEFMPLEELVEPYLVKDRLYVGVEFEVISMSNYC